MRGVHNGTLAPIEETENSSVLIASISATRDRFQLRRRNQSARPEDSSAIRAQVREELHMRFWSLQHDTVQRQTMAAAPAGVTSNICIWRAKY